MLVVHAIDHSTLPATTLYSSIEACQVYSPLNSNCIKQQFNRLAVSEQVVPIGRGNQHGLRRYGIYQHGTHPDRNPVLLGS